MKTIQEIIEIAKAGKDKEAKVELEKIIDLKKDDYQAHHVLGVVCAKLNDFDKAIDNLNLSIKINPKNKGVYFELGNLYRLQNNNNQSKNNFLKAINLDQNFIEAYISLAKINENENNLRVLDIGTGSGCIPLALKQKRKEWEVSACDISETALGVAKRNSLDLGLNIEFFTADIISAKVQLPLADVYISNPPYIPEIAKADMHSNVMDHEPHLALFAPAEDPLAFYKRIALMALKNSAKSVYFETHATNMELFKNEMAQIWKGTITVRKDMVGKERFVILK